MPDVPKGISHPTKRIELAARAGQSANMRMRLDLIVGKRLNKIAMALLACLLLAQATGTAWASAIDCCDDEYAACLSDQSYGPCALCAAIPAVPSAGFIAPAFFAEQSHKPCVFSAASFRETRIWRPPIEVL